MPVVSDEQSLANHQSTVFIFERRIGRRRRGLRLPSRRQPHFFFQAEDGIRDSSVTGVQTCALPISDRIGARGASAEVKTQIVSSQEFGKAVALLRAGETVALPTETVYGLAADSLNPLAVAKIFEAKGRPRFDPLIVHPPERAWLEKIADLPQRDRQLTLKLAEKFWPGPFTMVLPKREIVPEIVTAGLDTVAVRISAHPVFAKIVREFGKPLAAPSANRFGRISPTTAQHVSNELDGPIPLIVDAGLPEHGI